MNEIIKDEKYYEYLDKIAKGLFNIIFRDGLIEDYHAKRCPIGDKEMEVLNRFGFNRMGYMLDLLFSNDKDDFEKFQKLCFVESMFLTYFDPLDFSGEDIKKLEEALKIIDGIEPKRSVKCCMIKKKQSRKGVGKNLKRRRRKHES